MTEKNIDNKELNENERLSKKKAFEEGVKLYYDAMKHLTTLSTGSTLILVAFLDKIFTAPKWRILVAGIFISFIYSIIESFFSMINFSLIVARGGEVDKDRHKVSKKFFHRAIFSFIIGISCLAIFILRNLF